MKKKITYAITLMGLLLPEITFASEYIACGEDKKFPLAAAQVISIFMIIVKIVVPILLVVSGMIAFLKVTFSGNVEDEMKKAKSKLVNSIIAAVVIFFIMSIVNFAISLVAGNNSDTMNCVSCVFNPEKCQKITCTIDDEFNETCTEPVQQ